MQIRIAAYRLAEKAGIRPPFCKEKQHVGWYWWSSFQKWYNRSLRLPESSSMNRAQSVTREALNEFYKILESSYEELGIADKPERKCNLNESGFMFEMRSGKIKAFTDKKYGDKQTFREKGTTRTVLPCVYVNGDSIPPLAPLDSRAIVRNAFKKAGIFPIDCNAIPDTAIASSLVTASNDNITEERTVEPYETLEENSQSEPSTVSDILIISTMNKPSKETPKKKPNESKMQNYEDVKKGKVYRPEQDRKTCDSKTNSDVGRSCEPSPGQIDANICSNCEGTYETDVKAKNGAKWTKY
ncbi:hypothetical protein HHI36_005382 [Cryptolaemus montrouzieri]|uniref:Uncharacterized protein n=1 Tax=Cryptolaemus montrouzieri TaxID=559131 RepID=A0ABD2NUH2_9CUCU